MWFAVTLGIVGISIVFTTVVWFAGGGFYLAYIPAATGTGLSQYSTLWILSAEAAAGIFLFYRKFVGLVFLLAPAVILPLDIYPAWAILKTPDFSLICHILHTALLWAALLSGLASWKYLDKD
jgi:hypothetical protein